ncbi:hypothetical protein OCH239_09390 [Roseivivax halodurans JCM 10272]|uniref:Uncharacterized protein n=1 Tax=Roseivivax halodurans JCM 10272 TaxID=1449350 RepID=X7EEV3_9RHOB|nr:sigma-70 family RNA polymerase sigma factor [Roseivivax halodurans]ETX13663.1 hypothetical protein OCH239_09390 [Roseivivax halodurans JCM 10272]
MTSKRAGECNRVAERADRQRSERASGKIVFSSTHQIAPEALAKAIHGAISRASAGAASPHQREDLVAETHLAIAEHAAAGKTLTGNLASFAYRIAYNKTCDAFRDRTDALARRAHGEAADIALDTAPDRGETPEARILRLSATAMKAKILTGALAALSTEQRSEIYAPLRRTAPLARGTAAQRTTANRIAQREKRAREVLTREVDDRRETL